MPTNIKRIWRLYVPNVQKAARVAKSKSVTMPRLIPLCQFHFLIARNQRQPCHHYVRRNEIINCLHDCIDGSASDLMRSSSSLINLARGVQQKSLCKCCDRSASVRYLTAEMHDVFLPSQTGRANMSTQTDEMCQWRSPRNLPLPRPDG
jgi:hypothetical protein